MRFILRLQARGPGLGAVGHGGPIQAGHFSIREQLPAGHPHVADDVAAAAKTNCVTGSPGVEWPGRQIDAA